MSWWKEKNLKSYGLLEFVSGPPLGGGHDENSGRPWKLIHSPPCRTPCRLFIHEVFSVHLGLHLCVWNELEQSPPFRPMKALRLQWSWAFNLVCEVTVSVITCCAIKTINCCVCGVAPLITSHALYWSRNLAPTFLEWVSCFHLQKIQHFKWISHSDKVQARSKLVGGFLCDHFGYGSCCGYWYQDLKHNLSLSLKIN